MKACFQYGGKNLEISVPGFLFFYRLLALKIERNTCTDLTAEKQKLGAEGQHGDRTQK